MRRAPDKIGNVNKSIAAVIKRAQGNKHKSFAEEVKLPVRR